MRQTIFGLFAGALILGAVAFSVHLGMQKKSAPAPVPVVPVAPAPQVTPPAPPTPTPPPTPPAPKKEYSPSFRHGYHDGYSGAWLAPARWMVVSEYRAGWNAGHADRVAGKPNMFRQN